ncbi:MAG: N-acetylmuramoyl-L-alanine amidase [Bacteroidales bacterium]|nr:N-acetylmuramoyl-L-alanine amidase [Bacteroidales bacterium]
MRAPLLYTVLTAVILLCSPHLFAQQQGVTLKTVVIDAGHGGKDPGAVSLDNKLKEKDVVLDIALTLGDKIKKAYPNINVIYTRKSDVYVELNERSNIANKNHADLFISIHCNSVPKKSKAPSGCETFIMGANKSASNMEVCKIENSVVLLEEDYSTKYQGYDPNDPESAIFFNLMQNAFFEQSLIFADLCQKNLNKSPIPTNRGIKQGGLLVLWRTTMPSVLVELGFITNSNDRNVLGSKTRRGDLANSLFTAFEQFKNQYEGKIEIDLSEITIKEDSDPEQEEEIEAPSAPVAAPANDAYYAVQIFAVSKNLKDGASEFKGEKTIGRFPSGSLIKYTVGHYSSEAQAIKQLPALQKKFKGAFVVKIEGGKIVKK